MDNSVIVGAVIAAIPVTITAIAGLIVSLRNGRKVEEVHKVVNSNTTALETKVTAATTRISEMQTELATANEHIQKLIDSLKTLPTGTRINGFERATDAKIK